MAEAAEIVGVTKSNFSAHRSKYSGEDQCPEPTAQLTCGPVWAGAEVGKLRKWAKEFAKIRSTRGSAEATTAKAPAKKAAPAKSAAPVKKAAAPTKSADPKNPSTTVAASIPSATKAAVAKAAAPKKAAPAKAAPATGKKAKGLFA